MTKKYVKGSYIQKQFDISNSTLYRWAKTGKLKFITMPDTGHRLYHYEHFLSLFKITEKEQTEKHKRTHIVYARVSSSHQTEDLKRQIEMLQNKSPDAELIQDVGSGLNFKRKGFQNLLERVLAGDIEEIMVTHRDRLSRFAFELVQWMCEKFDCKIVVLNEVTDSNPSIELAEDVLSIINYFTAKNNGMRAAKNRKERKKEKEATNVKKSKTGTTYESTENQTVS